jgi:hypothetical protein
MNGFFSVVEYTSCDSLMLSTWTPWIFLSCWACTNNSVAFCQINWINWSCHLDNDGRNHRQAFPINHYYQPSALSSVQYKLHCGKNFRIFWDAADQTLPVTGFSKINHWKIKFNYLSRNIQLQVMFGLLHLGKSGSFRHSVSCHFWSVHYFSSFIMHSVFFSCIHYVKVYILWYNFFWQSLVGTLN